MTDKLNETTTKTTTSTIKTGLERLAQLYPHVSEDTSLPSKWNSKEKASTLVLQQNNLVVTYKGKHFFDIHFIDFFYFRTWKIT